MDAPKKIAAAYIRVSTDDQLEYSPESQLQKIKEYATQHQMLLSEKYIFEEEEGLSGRKADSRPEFQRMIGTAKKKPKPFDIILLWKFSRFARNRQDSIVYKTMLRKQLGIEVVSITEQLGDDKMSMLVEAMIEAMDEYYSINLAEEVRRGMSEKVRRGEPVTRPAFGYDIKNKQYVPCSATAPILKNIFRQFAGGTSCREIAITLNNLGIRTRRGALWDNKSIRYLLKNPVYIGKIRWNSAASSPQITAGSHTPLISIDLWNTVQNRLAHCSALPSPSHGKTFLLKGLLVCSNCGRMLSQSAAGTLQCTGYTHGLCCESHYIKISQITKIVLAVIKKDFSNKRLIISPPSYKCIEKDSVIILQNQIQKENQKLERIKAAYENGIDTLKEYTLRKKQINTVISHLKSQLSAAKPSLNLFRKPLNLTISEILDSPSISVNDKNILLHFLIEKIIFDRKNKTIVICYKS